MKRTVSCHLELSAAGPTELVFSVAVARGFPVTAESMRLRCDGADLPLSEVADEHGTRLHVARVRGGDVVLDYEAEVDGLADADQPTDLDRLRYLRQSRYCESDTLTPIALSEFAGLEGIALLQSVTSWVRDRITYVPGSSTGTDSAVDTLLARRGVCRDFAHLCIALLRALDVPARMTAVYAPGLSPMEFHAVCEALHDGAWWVLDATSLAPRRSLVRIATGHDAADTAFLSSFGAAIDLRRIDVTAVVDDFETDDDEQLTPLR